MTRKKWIFLLLIIVAIAILVGLMAVTNNIKNTEREIISSKKQIKTYFVFKKTIELKDIDGKETNYKFTYNGNTFKAVYTPDNWHIINSYKIDNKDDMALICNALINIHPIHGKDMKTYRTVEDLVYEWEQHNVAYALLPEDSVWKQSAKDIDLDPKDQGKNMIEIYQDRAGKN